MALSWTNPADADLQGVMVRRATGATAPTSPTAGTLVADVPKGTTTLTDTALSPGTQYSYAFFAHDAVPNYATAATKTATTTAVADTTPPGPVTTVTLTGTTSSSVSLSWTNPADADLQGVMVRRATGATAPTSPTAGTLVADVPKGTTTLTDTALSPGTQYSYAFFAHDAVPNYATAATKTASTNALCGGPEIVHVSGAIDTDTIWAPDSCGTVWVLDNQINILAGVTLTINPGAIVKAANGVIIQASGRLNANGTAASPVVFTSWLDDTAGGDTNGDGGATIPAMSDWAGIAGAGAIGVDRAVIRYAVQGVKHTQHSGSLSVTNSTFTDLGSGGGISSVALPGPPVITGNTITGAVGPAIFVGDSDVDLAKLDGNSGSSNGLNGITLQDVSVTADGSLPWSGNLIPVLRTNGTSGGLYVPTGVTVSLNAGTVIKAFSATINVAGTVHASGAIGSPVVLTSMFDTTVAGDTAPMYASQDGKPNPDDWAGIAGAGAIGVDRAVIRYAVQGVKHTQHSGSLSVTNSTFTDLGSGGGISSVALPGPPVITGNTITGAVGPAIFVGDSDVDLAKLDGNSGSSNGLNGITLQDVSVTADGSLPWSGNLIPVLRTNGTSGGLYVPTGVTVSLNAGTVIKAFSATINVAGTVHASGAIGSPVVLTSMFDTTVAGDTAPMYASQDGKPNPDDWAGIAGAGAIGVDRAVIRYAVQGVKHTQHSGSLSVTNSTFTDLGSGGGISSVALPGPPVITGNTITGAVGPAIFVGDSDVDLAKLDGNSGSSNGLNGITLQDVSVTADGSLPWSGNLIPVLRTNGTSGGLYVPTGVTVSLNAGTVIKAFSATINVAGTVHASGAIGSPVVLTSMFDTTVAGDTAPMYASQDGKPNPDDWAGIHVVSGADVDLSHVRVGFANVALAQTGGVISVVDSAVGTSSAPVGAAITQSGGDASLRGTVNALHFGITSCSWGAPGCGVDASHVDWGGPEGPKGLICGQVWASPFLYAGNERYAPWEDGCSAQATPSAHLASSRDNYYAGLDALEQLCAETGDQSVCSTARESTTCLSGAYISAGSTSPFPFPPNEDSPDYRAAYTDQLLSASEAFLAQSGPTARVAGRLISVLGIFDTVVTLGKLDAAYRSCAP